MCFACFITTIMLFEFKGIIRNRKTANKFFWYTTALFYLLVPVTCLVILRFYSLDTTIWLVLTIAASDIGGYAAGKAYGKHKLAPKISPGKTWEGLVGCCFFAAVVSAAYTQLPEYLVFGVLIALVSQAGDLTESLIKRYFNVKNSASLIPGHGGLMDRLDGYLYAAPLVLFWQVMGVMSFV
jgi:phosphatidate cytidylyltransferase